MIAIGLLVELVFKSNKVILILSLLLHVKKISIDISQVKTKKKKRFGAQGLLTSNYQVVCS